MIYRPKYSQDGDAIYTFDLMHLPHVHKDMFAIRLARALAKKLGRVIFFCDVWENVKAHAAIELRERARRAAMN